MGAQDWAGSRKPEVITGGIRYLQDGSGAGRSSWDPHGILQEIISDSIESITRGIEDTVDDIEYQIDGI